MTLGNKDKIEELKRLLVASKSKERGKIDYKEI